MDLLEEGSFAIEQHVATRQYIGKGLHQRLIRHREKAEGQTPNLKGRDRFQTPELAQQPLSPDPNLAKVEVAEEPEQTYSYVVDLIRGDSVVKLLKPVVGEAIYIDEGGRDLVWDLVWDLEKAGENVQMTVELSRIQFWEGYSGIRLSENLSRIR